MHAHDQDDRGRSSVRDEADRRATHGTQDPGEGASQGRDGAGSRSRRRSQLRLGQARGRSARHEDALTLTEREPRHPTSTLTLMNPTPPIRSLVVIAILGAWGTARADLRVAFDNDI